jgi:4-amino-4-deoxy-L-arabinose transferase-like glycosyltransferase
VPDGLSGTGRKGFDMMSTEERRLSWLLLALSAVVPVVQLVALAVAPSDYGYFIDEFYYIACSKRLAFGYVDHPPLSPAILAATRLFLGESLLGIRLVPFLAGGATIWIVGRLAREFGGGRFAVVLSTLAFGLSPIVIAMTSFYSMNAFELLLWAAVVLTVVRLAKTRNSKLWLLAGVLGGLAFENKHTIVVYVAALGCGVVLAAVVERFLAKGDRTASPWSLRDPWLWAGAAVAIALAIPNVAWQFANGWPSLEFYRNATLLKNISVGPVAALFGQVQALNPVTFPIWLAGVCYLLFAQDARRVRFAGVMFLVLLAAQVVSQSSRPDRIAAAYPAVMAAGAVALERFVRRPVLRAAIVTLVVLTGAALAPLFLPILPPDVEARYVTSLHADVKIERGKTSPLPQLLADRTGWRSFVADVERVYRSLPSDDQRRAVVYVPSYGHAGSLELWGPALGLPRVISNQNTYWHWSDGHASTPVLIAVGARRGDLERLYRNVRQADTVRCAYCMSWRNDMPIYIATDPIVPLDSVWRQLRHYE